MLFTGGYNTENFDNDHHCYINQFGIYLPGDNNHEDEDHDDDDGVSVNMPAMGTDWRSFCMEAKYRTFVTLQQMLEFAYIGAVGSPLCSLIWLDSCSVIIEVIEVGVGNYFLAQMRKHLPLLDNHHFFPAQMMVFATLKW